MAQLIDFFGTTRTVPENSLDVVWSTEVTNVLLDAIRALGSVVDATTAGIAWLISNVPVPVLSSKADTALAAGATITQTHPIHIVKGSGGAITLNGTTAIANGARHGVVLILLADSGIGANTVTVNDGANVVLRTGATFVIDAKEAIAFWWDSVLGDWRELWRSGT